ncbi:hypothetical protein [Actinoplanes sp. TFC3]|uniref:hypothetical protein n=1 Tax=Actinoplanes sp. TFC3 TaxID=1710355 RepID=UPI0008325298|nr:hypothetical protein [Actinoplanes sp. TFC3]
MVVGREELSEQFERSARNAEALSATIEKSAEVHEAMRETLPGAAEHAAKDRRVAAEEREAAKTLRAHIVPPTHTGS